MHVTNTTWALSIPTKCNARESCSQIFETFFNKINNLIDKLAPSLWIECS